MLTKSMALELAEHGITVNAVAPGVVETGMTRDLLADPAVAEVTLPLIPLGRAATPEDVAAAILSLITGSDMAVFTAAAMDAPADSVWSAQSGPWQLKARPVIPGAVPCTGGW